MQVDDDGVLRPDLVAQDKAIGEVCKRETRKFSFKICGGRTGVRSGDEGSGGFDGRRDMERRSFKIV